LKSKNAEVPILQIVQHNSDKVALASVKKSSAQSMKHRLYNHTHA